MLKAMEKKFVPSRAEQTIYRQRLIQVDDVTSNVVNQVQGAIDMNPTNSSEWTTFSSLYDEFRVVGIRINLFSVQQYSVTALNSAVGFVYDNDDSAVLASIQTIAEYPTVQWVPAVFQHHLRSENQPMCQQYAWARPTSGSNTAVNWVNVGLASTTTCPGSVKYFGDSVTSSTKYYRIVIERFVEFRGRR